MAYPFGGWQLNPYSGMPPIGFGQGQYQQQMAQQAAPKSGGTKPLHDGADNRRYGQGHGAARRNALDHRPTAGQFLEMMYNAVSE